MTYRKRNIINHDVESRRSPHQVVPHHPRDVLSLRDQLACVKLCHHALQHLVDDARQHTLVVVLAQGSVYLWQSIDPRSRQNTTRNVHHLQVLGSGQGRDAARLGADVVIDRRLQPGEAEVGAFVVDVLGDTT